jgi:cytochrome c peroxidase
VISLERRRILAGGSGFALVALLFVLPAGAGEPEQYRWNLPKGFPKPRVPANNPMSVPKVKLGCYLFYDKRMSVNETESCGTCHRQELAFTDGKARAIGAEGQEHSRGAMSLVNVAYNAALTWANPQRTSLEEQALTPPMELGLRLDSKEFLGALRSDPVYRSLFPASFSGQTDPFTLGNILKALAAFERTIISGRSPYDRYHYDGDGTAISDSAKRGELLFFLEPHEACFRCHGGFNFSDATDFEGRARSPTAFHNTGLYNLPGLLSYPEPNTGIYAYTKRAGDVGKFKAPTLRNIAVTAPYMHDGSVPTLEEVLSHYSMGGRTIAGGPLAGAGHDNPNKDKLVRGFYMTPQNRADLIAFLNSLTDEELLHNPRFSNPW